RTIFLDTVGLLALWDTSDQWHSAAEQAMDEVISHANRLVTTPHVLYECGNAMSRTNFRTAVCDLRVELNSHGNLIVPTEEEEAGAWASYANNGAGNASIVDHVSFEVMRRLGILESFTNDHHFSAVGLLPLF